MPNMLPEGKNGYASGQATVDEYLAALKASPRFGPQVAHHEVIAARDARYSDPAVPWPPALASALAGLGIPKLYSHQAAAVDLARSGRHVMVATPTASGKSLVYNLPVFERLMANPEARALYLFPLKALAQDQLRAIGELARGLPENLRPDAAICDGDTSDYRRRKLRENPPRILISNPDMLHLSFLGYHGNWARFWGGLAYIILDEVHTYRGVFGSHMAWVVRRLARICRHYGSQPVFILSSATIGNPGSFARDLLGVDVEVVTETGAPSGERHFLFLDPYDGASGAACQLLEAAVKRNLRTIVYTQSRKMTELISVWTRTRLGALADKVTSYRAGYLPEERRDIEARLTAGDLLAVVSTSALELGIDIGALDICILVGYPGTIMATWQRGGRVGRRLRDSAVILIAHEDALDQYFLRNPKDFFQRGVESAVVNPDNEVILRRHLVCAAAELPLAVGDLLLESVAARKTLAAMTAEGLLLQSGDGARWFTNRRYPHREVDLRGSGQSFTIVETALQRSLGEVDFSRALRECHPGAVYLHRGETWLVTSLDIEARRVDVVRREVNYFTRALAEKETEILEVYAETAVQRLTARFGRLRVTDRVSAFQRRLTRGQKLIATEALDLPPMVFETEGLWLMIPEDLRHSIEKDLFHFMGGIHALEHAAIGMFPLLVLCDRNDVGGIAHPNHPQLEGAAVFIYDGHPGGVGLAREVFGKLEDLLALTERTITSCPCETGCPSCVHSPKCGSGNRPIDKEAARRLLVGLRQTPAESGIEAVGPEITQPSESTLPPATAPAPREKKEASPIPPFAGMVWEEPAALLPPPIPPVVPKQDTPPAVVHKPGLPHYGVFDLETMRSAEEVGGWHQAHRMGVSVAVLYDSRTDSFTAYREHELDRFLEHLRTFGLVVGFNNKRFDNLVLSAYTGFPLHTLPTLDILEEVKRRLGYRLSLDSLAENTLGMKKTADGLAALRWFREGRFDELIAYCESDVAITRDLFLFGFRHEYLLFRNKAGMVARCPVKFGEILARLATSSGVT